VLLLAAALDGRAATEALARDALLPAPSAALPAACGDADMRANLGAAAALVGDARLAQTHAQKNAAVRALMATAGWQWAGAMALGLGLVKLSRTRLAPSRGVALALLAWAAAAWAARVPWPLGGGRQFELARLELAWSSPPANFVLVLIGVGCALSLWPGAAAARALQSLSSRIGYPGLVLATGVGWLLLLDLSAHGHLGNRYLALYHQGHLWLAMLVLSIVLFLRQPLAGGLAWTLSALAELVGRTVARRASLGAWALFALAGLGGIVVAGLVLSNMRQLTSELGRLWLVVGAAWFFFLRGDPLAARLARTGPVGPSLLRYAGPLLFVAAGLFTFMLVTRDMGPLLIASYAAGAFVAAALGLWWHLRSGRRAGPLALAMVVFVAWIAGTTLTLFRLGAAHPVAAARLESLAAPLASGNDQLALVTWFQRAAPADGYGLGHVPWCGHASVLGCGGVPAQIHSDYTFTAIVGAFGPTAAWAAALGCALWLHRLVRHHGRITRGEPRFVARSGRVGVDAQGFLSWVALGWVVLTLCQLAVTVAGNLAVLPLTGVTFPFVSFGMTSLVVNMAFLALALNVDVPAAEDGP
jgi:cell division protein FtsW (lipid II flippase)